MKLSEILKAANAPQEQIDAALEMEKDGASLRREASDKRIEIKALSDKMTKFDGLDPEKYTEAMGRLKKIEEDDHKKSGDWDVLREKLNKEHATSLEKANGTTEIWKEKYRELAINKNLIAAAARHKAIDPEEVALLTRGRITMDDDGVVSTMNATGEKMTGDDGKPTKIDDFVGDWLKGKAHLVQGSGGGSGSKGGGGDGGDSNPDLRGKTKIAAGLKKRAAA